MEEDSHFECATAGVSATDQANSYFTHTAQNSLQHQVSGGQDSPTLDETRPFQTPSQWNSVYWSMLTRSSRQCASSFFQEDSFLDKAIRKNAAVMEHYGGKNTSGIVKNQSPNMIKGLNPYQVLCKLPVKQRKV